MLSTHPRSIQSRDDESTHESKQEPNKIRTPPWNVQISGDDSSNFKTESPPHAGQLL